MENLFLLGFIGAAVALIFAFIQRGVVMKHSEGNDKMVEIAQAIRDGANAYLKHQYMTVGKVFAIVFVILLIMAFAGGDMLSKFTPFAFITGGVVSMLAGFIGMKIATNSRLAGKKSNWIDFNAGVLVEDKTMEEETKALFDLVVETASGKQVCSEAAGFHDMAIFKQGVTL